MADEAHIWTDGEIAKLEARLRKVYDQAGKEMRKKQQAFLASYEAERSRLKAQLDSGRITKSQYNNLLGGYAFRSQWYADMTASLAQSAVKADARAMEIVNNATPQVFAENHNFITYVVENGLGISTAFSLVDRSTVNRLIRDNPNLLPQWKIDQSKDYRWNKQKFNSAITQGILQGESIDEISKRISSVLGMNQRNARMNARTAMTAAQNAGRMESLLRMRESGIDVRKEWVSTLDHRTRDSHRAEDKGVQELEDRFPNTGLMFPGDMSTNDPGEVYNCRCTLIASFDEVNSSLSVSKRHNKNLNMTYAKWKKGKRR